MNMSVDLKLRNISYKAKQLLIEDILDNMRLLTCKKTRCQNLSGGQRKRLSVALELVNNPPIMFLDEPTTGLDSSSSSQCVQLLKNLAKGGRNIICTIHQPSAFIYEIFDHVYVMAEGRCVYQGSSENTLPYLSSLGFNCPHYHNPADYFLEVVNGEYGNYTEILTNAAQNRQWRRAIPKIQITDQKAEIKNAETLVYNNDQYKIVYESPTEWTRFWILLSRCGVQLFRDWTISQLKIVLHVLVGVFLGLTFERAGDDASKVLNNLGLMFCSLVYLSYTSMMPAVLKFPSEVGVLRKERFNNWYKLKTYYAAFLVSDIPLQITFSLAYSLTSYFISSQLHELRRFLMVFVIQVLVALSASSLGLVLGTIVNPINGTFFGAIILAVMIVLSGFLIVFTHMSKVMYMFTYTCFLSFAIEGLMEATYGFNRPSMECSESVVYCQYTRPEALLKDMGMDKKNYWLDVGYLVTTFLVLRVLAFCTLRRKLSSA
ncbi:hypothetical protein NQ318_010523 [Aromia moschata]|uniref:Uncharacterized protein n=1 Tax=Aromia moschata TaxID=1265417 RepID=A0AAV8YH67_9CUCU|nr:hypothetical protein NQ318_010523 [Aromia moschata]